MASQCSVDRTHKSASRSSCSICGAAMTPGKRAHRNPAPLANKGKSRSSRRCINCGFEMDSREAVCEQCGCEYFGTDPNAQPVIDVRDELGADPPSAPASAGQILERVLKKQVKQGAMILQASLSIDLKRRDARPLDEAPPANQEPMIFAMNADVLPFGRVSNWMEVRDTGVSRAHGEFVRQSDGSYCVRDVGSQNGTYVNGSKLKVGEFRKIKPGDEITFGFWHLIKITWGS